MAPSLTGCHVKVYAGHSPAAVVAEGDCSPDGIDPVPVWLSTAAPTRIQVSYRTDFSTTYSTPRVNYVRNSPVQLGITLATFSLHYPDGRCKHVHVSQSSSFLTLTSEKNPVLPVAVPPRKTSVPKIIIGP